jgi:DNA repair exonuclease SbcCD ATPase subunit
VRPAGRVLTAGLALGSLLLAGWAAAAQEPSLGDAARKEKDRRSQAAKRAPGSRVFTNEDLESMREGSPRGNLNIMEGQASAEEAAPIASGPRGESAGPRAGSQGETARPGPPGDKGGDEAAWQGRADQVRAAIEAAQSALGERRAAADRLREQLSPMASPYLEDPNARLRLQDELTQAERAIEQAQKDLEEARARYQELLQDAQRQRIPAGWISNAS